MVTKQSAHPPEPLLSAGIVPVFIEDTPKFLLLRVFKYWDFPKGLVEQGENPLAAAKRELLEETGLADAVFAWGEDYFETEPYRGKKIARYYLAKVSAAAVNKVVLGINPELGHAEHHEYRWVTAEEAAKLLVPRVASVLAWAAKKVPVDFSPRDASGI